jgi:hypothetical protein
MEMTTEEKIEQVVKAMQSQAETMASFHELHKTMTEKLLELQERVINLETKGGSR